MSMKPLLIEIGVEEIPAGVAPRMGEALKEAVEKLLTDANVAVGDIRLGVTPRRLLLHAATCPVMQADREETIWGPPERVAFADGKATGAAIGFAKKSGLSLDDFELADKGDGKGLYMKAMQSVKGQPVADMLAAAMPGILRKLPSPKQMQWQDGKTRSDAFIRPVRWIVALLGDAVIPFSFAGIESGKDSCGHRVHGGKGEIDVADPFGWLSKQCVAADREKRKQRIHEQLFKEADANGVFLVKDEDLLDEVTDLVEWPCVVAARYDEGFLRLPSEVSRIELKNHQRCFSSQEKDGGRSNCFFTVANIESKNPSAVAHGNVRVVNARLADAAFYYDRDPKESLEDRVEKLNQVVFQDGLGMVGDQVARLRVLARRIASCTEAADLETTSVAAYLCKSDLTTGLVGEFPELQGYMGGQYARLEKRPDAVAEAIEKHYEGSGSLEARAICIAENIDKLLGYFQIGKIPTASADPFALRRSAIKLIELLSTDKFIREGKPALSTLDNPTHISLKELIRLSARQWNEQRITVEISPETEKAVYTFIVERLLNYDWGLSYSKQSIEAALESSVDRPLYQVMEIARILSSFSNSEAGQAAAAANKRIVNILKKVESVPDEVNEALFAEPAEKALFEAIGIFNDKARHEVQTNGELEPEDNLALLAELREPVDRFFDDVMVMAEDEAVRANRLALLTRLRGLFLKLADISRL